MSDIKKLLRLGKRGNVGDLSKQYESVGDPSFIFGKDERDKVYGMYQFSVWTGDVQRFVKLFGFSEQFKNMEPATVEFDDQWKKVCLENGAAMRFEQYKFAKKTFFEPLLVHCSKYMGNNLPMYLQQIVWSIAMQHGQYGGKQIIDKALLGNENKSDYAIIKLLYDSRKAYVEGLNISNILKEQWINRYIEEERNAYKYVG